MPSLNLSYPMQIFSVNSTTCMALALTEFFSLKTVDWPRLRSKIIEASVMCLCDMLQVTQGTTGTRHHAYFSNSQLSMWSHLLHFLSLFFTL